MSMRLLADELKLPASTDVIKKARLKRQEAYHEATCAFIREYNKAKTVLRCSDCVYCAAEDGYRCDGEEGLPRINFLCHFSRPETDGGDGFEYPPCPGLYGWPCANFTATFAGGKYDSFNAKANYLDTIKKANEEYCKAVEASSGKD